MASPAGMNRVAVTKLNNFARCALPAVVSTAALPRHADRVAILFNPKAGPNDSRERVERLADLLEKRGFTVAMLTDLAEAASQANRWHADGVLRAWVGVGGDGTAAELINRADDGVPLSFLPAGNSNLLAVYFRLSKDPAALCRTIADGVLAQVDAGEANGRLFALMVSCGFDADVVRRVHENRTGHINLGSYCKPILKSIGSYEFPEIRIQWDETSGRAGRGTVAVCFQPPLLWRRVPHRPASGRFRRAVGRMLSPPRPLLAGVIVHGGRVGQATPSVG